MSTIDVEKGVLEDNSAANEDEQAESASTEAFGGTALREAAAAAAAGHLLHLIHILLKGVSVRHVEDCVAGGRSD